MYTTPGLALVAPLATRVTISPATVIVPKIPKATIRTDPPVV
jgi:hypothetical protein